MARVFSGFTLGTVMLFLVLILYIVSISTVQWYKYSASITVVCDTDYWTYMGLMNEEDCVKTTCSGTTSTSCSTNSYQDMHDTAQNANANDVADDYNQAKAAGAVAMTFLVLAILFTVAILIIFIVYTIELCVSRSLSGFIPGSIGSRIRYLPLLPGIFGVLSWLLWAALYPYSITDNWGAFNGDKPSGGYGFALTIVGSLLAIITSVVLIGMHSRGYHKI